ncbi:MAG: hypothetical protein WBB85_10905, partial [Albidovulum sp.]|uniref:hypothetical protein n=1 Tax=Albidovulum sp. TaxID=1872424 RepID=UPI003C90E921
MRDTIAASVTPPFHTAGRGASFAGLTPGIVVSLVVAAAFLSFHWGRLISHDTAWYLVATREWLSGARLYVDIYEVNPPLNFYFTVPPVLFADLTGMDAQNAQYLVFSLLIMASLMACWSAISDRHSLPGGRRVMLQLGLGLAMTLPSLSDTGQREHLMVILVMPWLVATAVGHDNVSRRRNVGFAILAALGICLKPYFLLIPIAVTLWHIIAVRSFRPLWSTSNLTMVCVGIAYVLSVWYLHPEYFRDIVPVAQSVYGSIAVAEGRIVVVLQIGCAPFVIFGLTLLARQGVPAGTGVFVSAALAGLGCYIVQWNGFQYHAIPLKAFAFTACLWVLTNTMRVTPLLFASLIGLSSTMVLALLKGPYRNPALTHLLSNLDPAWSPERIMVVSTRVSSGPIVALNLNAEWTSRYPHAWLVPGALNGLGKAECRSEPQN